MGEFNNNEIDSSERALIQLLIKLNIVSQAQVTEALEYQSRLPSTHFLKLEQILVDMEFLTETALHQAHSLLGIDDTPHQRTGEESRHASQLFSELFSQPHYEDSGDPNLPVQNTPIPPLSINPEWDIFLAQAAIPEPEPPVAPVVPPAPLTPPPVQSAAPPPAAIQAPVAPSVAPPAYQAPQHLMPPAPQAPPPVAPAPPAAMPAGPQAAGAFAQRSQMRPGSWSMNPPAVPQAPAQPPSADPRSLPSASSLGLIKPQLGEILLKNKEIEEWQLTHALCMQRDAPDTTPKLGTLLVKLGYVKPQAVERALSMQFEKPEQTA